MRGTFANIRLRNQLAPGTEGGVTRYLPDGEEMTIYDAAMKYAEEGTPLVVLAGKEYGSGSSRDWAAKGTKLLGVRAVIAECFERIHRSNLVGMGVLPLQFADGESAESLGLTGEEEFSITGHRGRRRASRREVTVQRGRQGVHRARADRHAEGGATTSATAASCRTCCASCARPEASRAGQAPRPLSRPYWLETCSRISCACSCPLSFAVCIASCATCLPRSSASWPVSSPAP